MVLSNILLFGKLMIEIPRGTEHLNAQIWLKSCMLAYSFWVSLVNGLLLQQREASNYWYVWSLLYSGLGERETDYPNRHHAKRVWGGIMLKPSVFWPLGHFYLLSFKFLV